MMKKLSENQGQQTPSSLHGETENVRGPSETLLPAWFVPRMMSDHWFYGLMMTNGTIIPINDICEVHQDASGTLWLDVGLCEFGDREVPGFNVFNAPTSRLTASINASHVMAAFELADT